MTGAALPALRGGLGPFLRVELAKSATCNAVLNGAVAWAVFHDRARIPVLGWRGLLLDGVLTAFFIAWLTPPILFAVVRARHRRAARIPGGWNLGWRLGGWAAIAASLPVVGLQAAGVVDVGAAEAMAWKTTLAVGVGVSAAAWAITAAWSRA